MSTVVHIQKSVCTSVVIILNHVYGHQINRNQVFPRRCEIQYNSNSNSNSLLLFNKRQALKRHYTLRFHLAVISKVFQKHDVGIRWLCTHHSSSSVRAEGGCERGNRQPDTDTSAGRKMSGNGRKPLLVSQQSQLLIVLITQQKHSLVPKTRMKLTTVYEIFAWRRIVQCHHIFTVFWESWGPVWYIYLFSASLSFCRSASQKMEQQQTSHAALGWSLDITSVTVR